MAEAGATLVPTFAIARLLTEQGTTWGLAPMMVARAKGIETSMAQSLKIGRTAGLLIGSGSDILGVD